jgi:ABC-type Mn2+/Zn2+ transport system permease subunit
VTLLNYLDDPSLAWSLVWRPLIVGAALVITSAVLSVLVVLKRLSFVGQGVSHAAFGGIGLAAILGVAMSVLAGPPAGQSASDLDAGAAGAIELTIILGFCVISALLMDRLSDRRSVQMDTAIGILLVGAMALGGVLVEAARQWAQAAGQPVNSRSWENILFGSMQVVSQQDVWVSWIASGVVVGSLWLLRRPLLLWATDEQAASTFGVPVRRVRISLMILLSIAVVVSMKLAGVVPASALLVLPGAIALQLSRRLGIVLLLAVGIGLAGLVTSMALALQLNVQVGPSLVLVLTGVFLVVWLLRTGKDRS